MKMSWQKLLASNVVTKLAPTKVEMDNLRRIVTRSLNDVTAKGLSTDARFIMSYDAVRTLSAMIVRAAGYRPRTVGGHYNTFVALEAADPAFTKLSAYFDSCRFKRNLSEYTDAGIVTETEAEELLKAARQFAIDAEAWIKANHPSLV
jgi:hypothetical protein